MPHPILLAQLKTDTGTGNGHSIAVYGPLAVLVVLLPIVFGFLYKMKLADDARAKHREDLDEKRFAALSNAIKEGIKEAVTDAVAPVKEAMAKSDEKWDRLYSQSRTDSQNYRNEMRRVVDSQLATQVEQVKAMTILGESVKSNGDYLKNLDSRVGAIETKLELDRHG